MKLKHLLLIALATCLTFSAAPKATAVLNLPGLPGLPGLSDLTELLTDMIEAYDAERLAILEDRQAFAQSIRDLPPKERRDRIHAFQEEQAERLAAHRELGDEIRQLRREAGEIRNPDARPAPERLAHPSPNQPERPHGVQELTDRFRAEREELLQAKKEVMDRDEFREASAERRQELLQEWRQNRAQIISDLQALAKERRQEISDFLEDRRND